MKKNFYFMAVLSVAAVLVFTMATRIVHSETSQELYPLAKKEGTVKFGGATSEKRVEELLAAFKKKYPGVDLVYVRKGGGAFVNLLETERAANRITFDVIHTSDPVEVERLKDTGYFMKYKAENWNEIPDKLKDKDGYYVPYGVTALVPGYNPRVIPAAKAPKSYKDFLDPQWKNMMSNSSPSRGGGGLVATARVIDLYGWEYIEKLVANGAMYVAGHGTVVRMLLSGERPLGWEITAYRAVEEEYKGNPLKIIWPPEGVPLNNYGMGIPAKAPHPAAAKLLLNYLISREGQAVMVKKANLWSALPNMKPPKLCKPLEQSNVWYPDMSYLMKNRKAIADKFDKIFGLK